MPATGFLDAAGVRAARRALAMIRDLQAKVAALEGAARRPIAVVGMACRFPGGADDPAAYWRLLSSGPTPSPRCPATAGTPTRGTTPIRTGRARFLPLGWLPRRIDPFDAAHFGISPREAEAMDPQQRLLLETVWQALEDAGELGHPRPAAGSGSSSGSTPTIMA